MIKKKCLLCGKEVISPKGRSYCNAACRSRHFFIKNQTHFEKKCVICDKPFTTTYLQKKYCSTQCTNEANRILNIISRNQLKISVEEYLNKPETNYTVVKNKINRKSYIDKKTGLFHVPYLDKDFNVEIGIFKPIEYKDITKDSYFYFESLNTYLRKREQSTLSDVAINKYIKAKVIKFFEKVG